jgi:hypothetical protein
VLRETQQLDRQNRQHAWHEVEDEPADKSTCQGQQKSKPDR